MTEREVTTFCPPPGQGTVCKSPERCREKRTCLIHNVTVVGYITPDGKEVRTPE